MKILFTSPGRRVELINIFRKTFSEKFSDVALYGADMDRTSPASYFLDKVFRVPRKIDDDYAQRILEISVNQKVDLIIPLIDPELIALSKFRDKFETKGILVMVSTYDKILIAMDKWLTYLFAQENRIKVPKTIKVTKDFDADNIKFPVILKPRYGSASKGIIVCDNDNDLNYYINKIVQHENIEYIVQEFIKGFEVTVDVFGLEDGSYIVGVQRRRLKIRAGEVERAVTQKDKVLDNIVSKIVQAYKPRGVMNIQFIQDEQTNEYYLLEMNPRFGGGYPLSYHAGVNFAKLILEYYIEKKNNVEKIDYIENLYMFRYDEAVYVKEEGLIRLL